MSRVGSRGRHAGCRPKNYDAQCVLTTILVSMQQAGVVYSSSIIKIAARVIFKEVAVGFGMSGREIATTFERPAARWRSD